MSFWICATCAVEHAERPDVCAICADDRQWVPADGQRWTTLNEMTDAGYRTELAELEPDLWSISSRPGAGIGQQSKLIRTDAGCLLFDPIGFLDDAGVDGIRHLGPVDGDRGEPPPHVRRAGRVEPCARRSAGARRGEGPALGGAAR